MLIFRGKHVKVSYPKYLKRDVASLKTSHLNVT